MILVTGATGFLGHNLVPELVRVGYPVRALVRPSSDTTFLRTLGVELVVGDIRDEESVGRAVAGCQFVVHAAGHFRFWGSPRGFERTNTEGTAYLLEAAARHEVQRMVHISSVAVVGNPEPGALIDEAYPCHPQDAYQRSKLDAEHMVRMFVITAGVPVIILRPGAFYGPWGSYAFNRLFFMDPLRGLRIKVEGGRRYTFPTFVPDVVQTIMAAFTRGRVGEIYNVCGDPITHNEVNQIISRVAGISTFRFNVPTSLMLVTARLMEWLSQYTGREPYYPLNLAHYVFADWRVSSEKARAELGSNPTPFEEGARQTIEWYRRMQNK